MRFGFYQPPLKGIRDMLPWWQACENAGLHMVGIPDSALWVREVYVQATACALSTRDIRIFTSVSNPVTRHPTVTAAALVGLAELAPGRIVFGVGSGDSALWSVGLKPAKVATLREYILAVKALLRGEPATWQGQTFTGQWGGWTPPVDVPVIVAVAGPKTLRMAAEVADGAIVHMGYAAEDIAGVRATVAEGLAASGRPAGAFTIWWNAELILAPSVEAAMERSVGWGTAWLTTGSLDGKNIPERYRDAIREMNADVHDIDSVYKTPARGRILVERAKRLAIYDWLLSRSPQLWGTPDDIARRFRQFADQGMTDWTIFCGGTEADRFGVVETFARDIAPRLG